MAYALIDFFAGIGGFTLGFEAAGFTCIGHCEIDRYAQRSYDAIHGVREGAWFANDITAVRPSDVPPCDCFTAGFPCQDISVSSGRGTGLRGARSSLFFEVIRIIQGKDPGDRPRWVVLENVKNLLSINRGRDLATVLHSLAESGYDVEYEVLNTKTSVFPKTGSGYSLSDILENEVPEKYFLSSEQTTRLLYGLSTDGKAGGSTTRQASASP